MNAGVTECRDVRFSGRFPGIETSKKRRKFYVEDRTLRRAKAVGHQNGENAEMPRQTVVGICTTSIYKTWRLEKFNNRDFLRWEKVAELFYAPERENSQQNSSLIRNLLLNSKAQDFWFCETQFCSEKDLNRNLAIQEGAKILFPLKKHLQKPFPQYSIKATKRNLRFFHFL